MTSVGPNKKAVLTAIRRFPHFELPIRRLIEADETFREICEELAEAEYALSVVENVAVALRSARRAEWQELIERLVNEVETAIRLDASARGTLSGTIGKPTGHVVRK